MADALWAAPFPAGVVAPSARYALIRDASGRVLVVGLGDGALLWRSQQSLKPLLIDDELCLGLAMQPPCVWAHALDGAQRWRSALLPWPEWLAREAEAELPSTCDLRAAWLGNGAASLWWTLRRPSGGGAGRGPRAADNGVTGACRFARADGTITLVDAATLRPPEQTSAEPSNDPQVLAQHRIGSVRYALRQQVDARMVRTTLVAHTEQGPAWQRAIDEIEPSRPTPPRPR
jgi:hypothetical protein